MADIVNVKQLLVWATVISAAGLVATLVAVPLILTRLPQDYCVREHRVVWRPSTYRPLLALIPAVLKNPLGLLLVALDIVMLLTPGQGVLTLLVGLLWMHFPGKYRLQRWRVLRPGVLRGLNWFRRRSSDKLPFDRPKHPQTGSAQPFFWAVNWLSIPS